jgi:hypothetical protein
MPANSVFFFISLGPGHFLLQEEGVSIGQTMTGVDLDFLVGEAVVEIRGDQIVFDAGTNAEPRLYVYIETTPDCVDADGQPLSLPSLVGRSVASASAKDGVLLLAFADGTTLRCEPDPDYEAWQVDGGYPQRLIVCCPGGQLSVWDETPPVPYGQLRERDPATAAFLDGIFEQSNMPRPVGFPPPERRRNYLSRLRRKAP